MTPAPTIRTVSNGRAAIAALVMLVFAAVPGEAFGTQRIEGASPEIPNSRGAAVKPIASGGERTWQTQTPDWRHGLQFAQLKLDAGKLGGAASKAVGRWPAAQKADPAWEWVRVLVFLVQSALVAQGHDPGKPDGLMGPKTMLALIAWSAVSGPSWDGDDEMSYLWGLDGNVAHLLHGTLETMGLSPGPKDRFLSPDSVTALERWDDTFRIAAMMMPINEDVGRHLVAKDLGAAGPDDAEDASNRSNSRTDVSERCQRPPYPEFAPGSGRDHHCLRNDCRADHCVEYTYNEYGHRVFLNTCDRSIKIDLCWKGARWSSCYRNPDTGALGPFSLRGTTGIILPSETSGGDLRNTDAPGLYAACFSDFSDYGEGKDGCIVCGPFAIDESTIICTCW